MTSLQPDETGLVGQWIRTEGKVVADVVAKRIEELITTDLSQVATSESGWDILYHDRHDGRFWELTYPHKEWHGGGPPTLICVLVESVRSKYSLGDNPGKGDIV